LNASCPGVFFSWDTDMIDDYTEYVISFLEVKKKEMFTGNIKISIEKGNLTYISESSIPEFSAMEVDGSFDLALNIKKACQKGYYGSLHIRFDNGKLTNYSYIQSWQGPVMDKMLTDLHTNHKIHNMTRVVKIKGKTRFVMATKG
jgi:hypothetical protein